RGARVDEPALPLRDHPVARRHRGVEGALRLGPTPPARAARDRPLRPRVRVRAVEDGRRGEAGAEGRAGSGEAEGALGAVRLGGGPVVSLIPSWPSGTSGGMIASAMNPLFEPVALPRVAFRRARLVAVLAVVAG